MDRRHRMRGWMVWFAQRTANRISQLDPVSGVFQSYLYTRPDAGLDEVVTVQPDSIWFTAPNVNGCLDPGRNLCQSIPTLPYTSQSGWQWNQAMNPG